MSAIYKYTLAESSTCVRLPRGAEVLHVDFQNEDLMLWARVDPAQTDTVDRPFRVFATGEKIEDGPMHQLRHFNTVFTGPYVFHVYIHRDVLPKQASQVMNHSSHGFV